MRRVLNNWLHQTRYTLISFLAQRHIQVIDGNHLVVVVALSISCDLSKIRRIFIQLLFATVILVVIAVFFRRDASDSLTIVNLRLCTTSFSSSYANLLNLSALFILLVPYPARIEFICSLTRRQSLIWTLTPFMVALIAGVNHN